MVTGGVTPFLLRDAPPQPKEPRKIVMHAGVTARS
jgi:hypothetical protein